MMYTLQVWPYHSCGHLEHSLHPNSISSDCLHLGSSAGFFVFFDRQRILLCLVHNSVVADILSGSFSPSLVLDIQPINEPRSAHFLGRVCTLFGMASSVLGVPQRDRVPLQLAPVLLFSAWIVSQFFSLWTNFLALDKRIWWSCTLSFWTMHRPISFENNR